MTTGVLVIAHGSRNLAWVELIDQAVKDADLPIPVEVGFLELVEGRSIKDGVRRLEEDGVQRILVIPLFITMGSTHLNEIQYALGVISEPAIETDMECVHPHAQIIWCQPIEDHPYVLQILTERISGLFQDPGKETILLVGHGSEVKGFHERWESLLERLAQKLQQALGFKGVVHATLHPDNLRKRGEELSACSRMIAVPVFLSEGYFTNQYIPRKLEGLNYVYDGKTYLPHPLISAWIRDAVDSIMVVSDKK